MEQIFTIIVFVVAVIISAIMRKKRGETDETESWPGSPSVPGDEGSQPKRISWEEELKRLLQGDTTPPPAPAPPPIIRPQPSTPAPTPRPARAASRPVVPVPAPAKPVPLHDWSKRKPAPVPLLDQAQLNQSAQAHERAQNLDELVAARMRETARRVESHIQDVRTISDRQEVRTALALLRSPESLRSSLIVSIILGPPKSMEDGIFH